MNHLKDYHHLYILWYSNTTIVPADIIRKNWNQRNQIPHERKTIEHEFFLRKIIRVLIVWNLNNKIIGGEKSCFVYVFIQFKTTWNDVRKINNSTLKTLGIFLMSFDFIIYSNSLNQIEILDYIFISCKFSFCYDIERTHDFSTIRKNNFQNPTFLWWFSSCWLHSLISRIHVI